MPSFSYTALCRAEQLLHESLSPSQLETYRAKGWFRVTGSMGGNFIVTSARGIFGGHTFNVLNVASGSQFCALVPDVPGPDCLLAQKLAIEHDENAFRLAANCSRMFGVDIHLSARLSGDGRKFHPTIRLVGERVVIEE